MLQGILSLNSFAFVDPFILWLETINQDKKQQIIYGLG